MWTCLNSPVHFFFRFCQFVGFLPFRIVFDFKTGQIKGFSRSWRYSITWWSILMAVINYSTHFLILIGVRDVSPLNKIPAIVQTTMMIVLAFCFVVFTSARFWLTFRFSTLNKALRHMREAENALNGEYFKLKSTLNLRIVTGSIAMFIWGVSFTHFSLRTDFLLSYYIEQYGLSMSFMLMSLAIFTLIPVGCALLTLHLIFYQMSHYIRVLRYRLKNQLNELDNNLNKNFSQLSPNLIRLREETKKSVRIFESICCAAAAWNKIFSIPLLLLITTRLITVSFGLFALIQGLFIPVDWIEGVDELFYLFFINDFVMLVIVFTAADMPSKEAKKVWESVINFDDSELMAQSSTDNNFWGLGMAKCFREDRLRFSTGLFTIGNHLIPSLTGFIITYLVILLQTQQTI